MLDQDLLFTYSRDLDPWYRIPLGLVSHAGIALALIGVVLLAARARRSRELVPVVVAIGAYALAHVGLHSTTLVEMRFGLPLLLLAGPVAAGAVRELSVRSVRARVLSGAFVVVWVAGALTLSHWMRQQAEPIVAWEKGPEAFAERRTGSPKQLKTVPGRAGVQKGRPRPPKEPKSEER